MAAGNIFAIEFRFLSLYLMYLRNPILVFLYLLVTISQKFETLIIRQCATTFSSSLACLLDQLLGENELISWCHATKMTFTSQQI